MSASSAAASRADAAAATRSGSVILIPKQLRAEWMDVMALDARLSHTSFRVAGVIGSHFNKHSGRTFLTHETIARVMEVSERTIYAAIVELEALGYLIVKRREFGTVARKTARGEIQVKVAGGKGVANTYFPAFERSQVAATNSGSKLANRCYLLWEQRSQKAASKVATDCDPTLTPSSKENPTPAKEPSGAGALGPLAAIIVHQRGEAEFRSWFASAQIVSDTPECLTISLPTQFLVSQVRNRYGDMLLRWVQLIDGHKTRVEIVKSLAGAEHAAEYLQL
jgi:helix-turn-helix protein/DnaA-like protein